jgi:hypothetical protein
MLRGSLLSKSSEEKRLTLPCFYSSQVDVSCLPGLHHVLAAASEKEMSITPSLQHLYAQLQQESGGSLSASMPALPSPQDILEVALRGERK